MSPYAPPQPQGAITANMVQSLRQTKPWVRLLSIVGFLATGFMLLAGLFMLVAGAMSQSLVGRASPFGAVGGVLLGVLYALLALLYLFPSLFLFRYASAIARMLNGETVGGMEAALEQQKSFWRFMGIMTLIVLCLYAVMLAIVAVVAVVGAMR
jgi:hypothetical protein